jgi:hypothetical protein
MTTEFARPLQDIHADDVADLALIEVLSPRFAPVLGDELVAAAVLEALAEVRADARIQQFVPLIAHRIASDRLRHAEQRLKQNADNLHDLNRPSLSEIER